MGNEITLGQLTASLVFFAAIMVFIAWRDMDDFRQWNEVDLYTRFWLAGVAFGTVVMVLVAVLAIGVYIAEAL